MGHACPHMVAPLSLGASPIAATLFCIGVLGQLRMFSVQPPHRVPRSETRVTQSIPSPGSRLLGFRDEQRDPHGLPRGTESKNEPVGRAASFPPAGLSPAHWPRGTASLPAAFPAGAGCPGRRWGQWALFKRRSSPSAAVKEVNSRRNTLPRPCGATGGPGACWQVRGCCRPSAARRAQGGLRQLSGGCWCHPGCALPVPLRCHLPRVLAGDGCIPPHVGAWG